MVWGLFGLLPEGRTWTKQERDRWFDLLHRILDYTVAVVDASAIPDEVKEAR